ncbi:MAG: Uma2 family endonuclease [Cyanobacteria bacterium]|nr:Uma2 family endonuclease [Cyanobacteriota bacterium]MDW8203239.1 Uma2 family endonuclease [Cyanobacteriota bacterium SKYGB_h_bin112]
MPSIPLGLPSTDELPCSDDTPVDNEDQNLLPNLLLFVLSSIWQTRMDWYFGVDMAIYHTTGPSPLVPVVPDAFLSLNVERKKGGKSRRSYATWEENGIVPIWVLEMVSHKPGGEYEEKMELYAKLGVLYYVIYNPEFWRRDGHQPFEVHKLVDGSYCLQIGEPYWMPEIGLGIGRHRQVFAGMEQELLVWFDAQRHPYPTPDQSYEQLVLERQRAEAAEHRAQQLEQYLRSLGVDPNQLLT